MGIYDFDTPVDRLGTSSIKWDGRKKIFGVDDLLPLWVADMDFASPPVVVEALQKRVDHGVFGYAAREEGPFEALACWLAARHGWQVDPRWMTEIPGVVPALNLAVQAFTQPGDAIVIQSPVYPPFFSAVTNNGRQLRINPLVEGAEGWQMDWDDLEAKARGAKMLILCSPHNPVGRVWTREELLQVAEICQRHGLVLVSDEIHSDLVFSPFRHIPTASLGEDVAARTVTLTAPSKTFNTAGLATAAAIISDPKLRQGFRQAMEKVGLHGGNLLGLYAMEAAYRHGAPWLEELLTYLEGNADFLVDYFRKRIPRILVNKPQATYLAWLDCRPMALEQKDLKAWFVHRAKVGLNDGLTFGRDGTGFMRLNFGCSRKTLEEALERIEAAFQPDCH